MRTRSLLPTLVAILYVAPGPGCGSANTGGEDGTSSETGGSGDASGTTGGGSGGPTGTSGDGSGTDTGSSDPAECMELAAGDQATVSTTLSPTWELVLPTVRNRVATGEVAYFAGDAEVPIAEIGGVAITAADEFTGAVVGQLDPDAGTVTSALGISGGDVRIQRMVAQGDGAWIQFRAVGAVAVGGMAAPDAATSEPEQLLALVRGDTVDFVHRFTDVGNTSSGLVIDGAGRAWLAFPGLDPFSSDCTPIVMAIDATGAVADSRCPISGGFDSPALAALEGGGLALAGFPLAMSVDLGNGPIDIDASAGGSLVGWYDAAGTLTGHAVLLRSYARALMPVPGGLALSGGLPQESDANGNIVIVDQSFRPCARGAHLTLVGPDGDHLWSRVFPNTTTFGAANARGDLFFSTQAANETPVAVGVGPLEDRNAFGIVSTAEGAKLLDLRGGFLPTAAAPVGTDAWIVTGNRETDEGLEFIVARIEVGGQP